MFVHVLKVKSLTNNFFFLEIPMIIDNVTSSPITVIEHDNVTMKCQARGRPIPYIAWFRRGEDVQAHNNQTRLGNQVLANNTDGLFHLINVSRRQNGHYECRASNGVNDHVVSKDIELRVLCKYNKRIGNCLILHYKLRILCFSKEE
jgi:hypothetical protein